MTQSLSHTQNPPSRSIIIKKNSPPPQSQLFKANPMWQLGNNMNFMAAIKNTLAFPLGGLTGMELLQFQSVEKGPQKLLEGNIYSSFSHIFLRCLHHSVLLFVFPCLVPFSTPPPPPHSKQRMEVRCTSVTFILRTPAHTPASPVMKPAWMRTSPLFLWKTLPGRRVCLSHDPLLKSRCNEASLFTIVLHYLLDCINSWYPSNVIIEQGLK